MPLYALLSRVLPLSFGGKLLAAVWLGLAVTAVVGRFAGLDFGPLVVACFAGGAVATGMILAVTAPVQLISQTIANWGRTGRVVPLPEGLNDDLGLLMTRVNLLMARAQRSLGASWKEAECDPQTGALNAMGAERILGDAGSGWLVGVRVSGLAALVEDMGRAKADDLLSHLVHSCSETVRQDDMVARISETSFLVFLPGASEEVANRIVGRVGARLDLQGAERAGVAVDFATLPYQGGGEPGYVLNAIEEALSIRATGQGDRSAA